MSERELYEYALIEMNKVEAPSLLLEDYNYFINKAVQQYINKVYNRYDINQQSSDDIRVLKATAEVKLDNDWWKTYAATSEDHKYRYSVITATEEEQTPIEPEEGEEPKYKVPFDPITKRKGKLNYAGTLPGDYVHILNCTVEFKVKRNFKCYRKGTYIEFAAKRLTADMASGILHNAYMKPDYRRPYFYINNINTGDKAEIEAKDTAISLNDYTYTDKNIDGTIEENGSIRKSVDRNSTNSAGNRVANVSRVRIEIRFGEDDSVFEPVAAYIDYIKAPRFIQLTYEDITATEDHTRPLEFPDYVCFEIVNEFVKLLMENASDPRLQTNFAINQTIGDPTVSNAQSQSKDKS